jgi:hypothetical protein
MPSTTIANCKDVSGLKCINVNAETMDASMTPPRADLGLRAAEPAAPIVPKLTDTHDRGAPFIADAGDNAENEERAKSFANVEKIAPATGSSILIYGAERYCVGSGHTASRRMGDDRILKPIITRQNLRVTLTMIKSPPLLACHDGFLVRMGFPL